MRGCTSLSYHCRKKQNKKTTTQKQITHLHSSFVSPDAQSSIDPRFESPPLAEREVSLSVIALKRVTGRSNFTWHVLFMLDIDGNVHTKTLQQPPCPFFFLLWHSELWWDSVVTQRQRQQQRRRYLDASGMSLLNQRPTATSTLSTSVTPISRDRLLTRNPEASNINLKGQNRGLCNDGWTIQSETIPTF